MIERLDADGLTSAADDLAALLRDVTDTGSSVGFLAPLAEAEAKAWWLDLRPGVSDGSVLLWAARHEGRVVGTVQLRPSRMPNGTHRAELAKLMVHTSARGQGLGRKLLQTAEDAARAEGLRLLILDTEEDSPAEPLYRSAGWTESGRIPDYAADPTGTLRPTVYFYRRL
ncbi:MULTISPECIES: GNAT family N-acetyltransferase [Actinokineospora]|uniref:N-acetyltransferase n=1 Tax=Actinokineospora fastidiosa TaxID=1816 RepID=A0A918GFI5_9PSEU|nr:MULTISPECIES: GNAT family N-acetyltransferase [Actinokineospora]UVS79972.1 Acetyltransferase [Actinokineospora sp. UTMC 2448]GGS32178.1 N-acetyltransferase [Actinokineospora fastidiosa]